MLGESKLKLQPYNLGQVMKLRHKIEGVLHTTYYGESPRGQDLKDMVATVHELLPDVIPVDVVYDSMKHLSGVKLTRERLKEEAWRIAGNVRRLKTGHPARPWSTQDLDEWVPVQIVECRPTRTPRGRFGAVFQLRVLAGTPCPKVFEKFWTFRFCRFLSQEFGFSPPWGEIVFHKMEEFVNLRLYVLLQAATRQLKFEKLRVTTSMLTFNKQRLKARARIDFTCPLKYTHPCHLCPVGYKDCPLGVHPRTYVRHECDECDKEAWFDPDWVALGVCVQCQLRRDTSAPNSE